MPVQLTPDLFADALRGAQEIYAPGAAGHSLLFERWLRQSPEATAGCRFFGVHLPGFNRFDLAALHAQARFAGPFVSADWQASWRAGRFEHRPQGYYRCARWLTEDARFDLALLQLAPPDRDGRCSLGVACDFTPAAWPRARRVLVHFNPRMPRTGGPFVPVSAIEAAIEEDMPLLEALAMPEDAALDAVAAQVSALVPDGATLQLGLGRLQASVLGALGERRGLRLHAGMVSDGLLALAAAGALDDGDDAVLAGVALGSAALYASPALMRVCFAPVTHTHDPRVLASLPRLHAINSALSVDLFGQVNGERLGQRQASGAGGLPDFLQAAVRARDGRGIIALPARTGRGEPRIVPVLPPGPVSLARGEVDTVVTEFGAVRLRDLDVDSRARALTAIAHPDDREALARAWHALRRDL